MTLRRRHLSICSALILGLTASAFANTESLEKNSPFLPPDYKPPVQRPATPPATTPKPQPAGKLEFRGAANIDGRWEFSIYDVKKRRGYWVAMNDPKAPYLVTSYNEKSQSITLGGGASQTLTLKEPAQSRMPGSYIPPSVNTPRVPSSSTTSTLGNMKGARATPSTPSRSPRSINATPSNEIDPDIKALLDSLK
jgi:hypothetical protein